MNPLSHEQKARVCIAARRAYDAWAIREEFELINPELSPSKCFEAWRRVEQGKAVGQQSLRLCTSETHYLPLLAHFAGLLGEGGRALQLLLRHAEEGRITVYFKLLQTLEERGLEEEYAATICRCKFKCALGEASEKQLWSLFFDVRQRRKAVQAARAKPARHVRVKAGVLSPAGDNPF